MALDLSGVALTSAGGPATRVAVLRWDTLDRVATITPDSDGAWALSVDDRGPFAVVATGDSGYGPLIDGPIDAVET